MSTPRMSTPPARATVPAATCLLVTLNVLAVVAAWLDGTAWHVWLAAVPLLATAGRLGLRRSRRPLKGR